MCTLCNIEDDRLHWLQCPRYQHIKDAMVDWRPDAIELPHCPLYHLLVPRPHCMVQWRSSLSALDEDGISFLVSPPPNGYHHLFLDGSCSNDNDTHTPLNLAAWGVVNATLGQPVASAPLAGITQTIDRAELMSLVASLQWVDGTELGTCLWSDSQSTVNMAEHIWRYDAIPDHIENVDLWTIHNRLSCEIEPVCQQTLGGSLHIYRRMQRLILLKIGSYTGTILWTNWLASPIDINQMISFSFIALLLLCCMDG